MFSQKYPIMTRTPKGTIELHFRSFTGFNWKLLFLHYTAEWSASDGLPLLGENPIFWESSGADDLSTTVRGCTGTVTLIVDGKNMTRERFNKFFNTQALKDLRIELYRSIEEGGNSYYKYPMFQGFVKTEEAEQPLQPYPYEVELTIVDSLAAGDYIRPENFMERCASLNYHFTMKNLLEWWMEDMDVEQLDVMIQDAGSNLEKPIAYTSDFMETTENVDMSPFSVTRAPVYNEIFDKMLGTNRMFFKGNQLEIHRNREVLGDHIMRYRLWVSDGDGVLKDQQRTRDYIPQVLQESYRFCGSEHTSRRLPVRTTSYTRPERRKEEVSLGIDATKNAEIRGQDTEEGYLWGQGNLITHGGVTMQRGKMVSVEKSSMKASVETYDGWIYLSPNNGQKSLTLRTTKPINYGSVDKMILTGRLVKREMHRESLADRPVYKTVNDYENTLKFSLQWGNLYSVGGETYHAADRPGWTTSEVLMEMKMVKDFHNGDTSNFFDPKTDPKPNDGTAFARMAECEENQVANYEGFHIFSAPAPIVGANYQDCGYITLRIYGSNTSSTYIMGLELKSKNEDSRKYTYGDTVDGEEIEYMYDGDDGTSVWSAQGNPAVRISKFCDLRIFDIIYGLAPMLYDAGTFYTIVGYSFSPRDETGDLSLLSY